MSSIIDQLNNPLDGFDTNELIAAIQQRHESTVILILDKRIGPDGRSSDECISCSFSGGKYTCAGMASKFACDVFTDKIQEIINGDNA